MKYIFIFLATFLMAGCDKAPLPGKVLTNFQISESQILADGQSVVSVSVEVDKSSSTDRRSVIFSTSAGAFTASGGKKETVKAEFVNGVLVAKAKLKAPLSPGVIEVSVQPEFDSPSQEYMLKKTIEAVASIPFSIDLEPSSFGIGSNHQNEVFITGKLLNTAGGFVSSGYKVLFENFVGSAPANGQFRNMQNTVSDTSTVSTYYSAFAHPVGTQIKIRGTVLDASGQTTPIKDSIFLTINL